MSRVTWFAAGALTGVYGIVRARRVTRNLTPDGLASRAAAVGAGLKVFTSEVGAGMAERERQLRDQLALTTGGRATAVPQVMGRVIERADNPRHRRDEPTTPPIGDGHRDGHR